MVVMIYAYESVYCGLHGINTGGVFEVDSVAEADDFLWSCVYHNLSIEDYFDSMKCSFELYNKYNNSKKYETLEAYILEDEKHFSIVSMWEV